MVQTCCLIQVRDGQLWEKHGEVRSRTPEDGPEGCTDRQTGTMSLEAAGGMGRQGCPAPYPTNPCHMGVALGMGCRCTTGFVKSPLRSGFPQRTQVVLVLMRFKEFWTWPSELKLIITDGLWKICFCIVWSAERIFDSSILVLDCTIQQVRERKTNDWVPCRAKPSK